MAINPSIENLTKPKSGHKLFMPLPWYGALAGALLAAVVALLSPGGFFAGWLAAALLFVPGTTALILLWQRAGRGKLLAWMIALALLLRLLVGIGLSLAMPVFGYDEPTQQAGYIFKDAYNRDQQAWSLAQSDQPLWGAFRDDFISDQYGGLLALSAGVYRYLSPDSHRPFLILVIASLVSALGVPFLYRAARLRWPERAAWLAVGIYVFYPDGVYFSSSQMREPLLIGLVCVAFWATLAFDRRRPISWLALLGSLLILALISSRVAAAAVGFLGLLMLLERVIGRQGRRWQMVGWVGLAIGALLVLSFSWDWFRGAARWDLQVTETSSGWLPLLVKEASERTGLSREAIRFPFVVGYGLTRPVLPAAIAHNTESGLWKGISIVRALGWYLLAPFLVYGLFAAWHVSDSRERRRAIWLALVVTVWVLIASARGGGDAIDNPRYRILFLPWLALLAGWAIHWALAHKDAWLWRWLFVEGIFVGFLTIWYFHRYFYLFGPMNFWMMLASIAGLSALVLVGGWFWDRAKRKQHKFTDQAN